MVVVGEIILLVNDGGKGNGGDRAKASCGWNDGGWRNGVPGYSVGNWWPSDCEKMVAMPVNIVLEEMTMIGVVVVMNIFPWGNVAYRRI